MDSDKTAPEPAEVQAPLGVSLLSRLDASTVSELRDAGTAVLVRAGEWLFRAGDEGDALFIVEAGRLEVLATDEDTAPLRMLRAGDAVGELALLCRAPRAASVRAVRDSALLRISHDHCARLVRAGGSFAVALLGSVGEKLRANVIHHPDGREPHVLAVVPLDRAASVIEIADTLTRVMEPWGRVASMRFASAADAEHDWGTQVDALERDHDFVVLVADQPELGQSWAEFCARQADRVLAVAGAAPTGSVTPRPHVDLVLQGKATATQTHRRWLDAIAPRAHHVVRAHSSGDDVGRLARRVLGRSVGLVLSGGGARGLAHIGVVDALLEAGVTIDRVGGTSMGAFVAALVAGGRTAPELSALCRAELVDRSPFRDFTWPRIALIRARRAAVMLERTFGGAHVEDLALDCFAVSADLSTAEIVVHRRGPVVEAVGASMSLPGLAPPVRSGTRLLVDGGVLNNVPVDVMAATGEGPVIAVDVMTRARLGSPTRMPSILETLARATVIGSHYQATTRLGFASLVIAPDVGTVGLLDFARFAELVESGRRATRRAIETGALAQL